MQSSFPGCSSFLIKDPGAKPKGQRWSTPRSKNGCRTCKKRKFKCDEEKPACRRCTDSNLKCEGYEAHPLARRRSPPNTTNPTQPPPTSHKTVIRPPPTKKLFVTDAEYRHFKIYLEKTAIQLAGCHELDIWTHLIPQRSESDAGIRHAITAIGALSLQHSEDLEGRRKRQAFAYRQYSKAIEDVKLAIRMGSPDINSKLVTCILFATFESIHGNASSMTGQIAVGIGMVEEYMRSSALVPIDKEVLEVFTVVEIESGAINPDGARIYLNPKYLSDIIGTDIPERFHDIKEARMKFIVMVSRALNWMHEVLQDKTYLPGPRHAHLERILSEFRDWSKSYEPLFVARCTLPKSSTKLKAAAMVRAHYLAYYLWLATASPDPTSWYAAYSEELREIVTMIRIISAQGNGEAFSLDVRIIVPLVVVGLRYRHRQSRRDLLDIIPGLPRRGGGVLLSVVIAKVIEWMIELEEEGLSKEEEYIPRERAVKIVKFEVDRIAMIVKVVCEQPAKDGTEAGGVLKERLITWT